MSDRTTRQIIEEIAANLDIPPFAYKRAKQRYEDLGKWFERPDSNCSEYDPHIYPQGSFRFGTVIRPLDETSEYDLDLGCRLRRDITKLSHTQKQLKELVLSLIHI